MHKFVTLCLTLLLASGFLFPAVVWASPILPSVDMVIDVGHGGIDSGTSYEDILEKDINLIIAKKVQQHMKKLGHSVILTRSTDVALSEDNHWQFNSSRHRRDLAQRLLIVRHLHPRLLISLHVNWSSRQSATGPVVLYKPDQQSYILANLLQHSLNQVYGTSRPPYYSDKFFLLNSTDIPAVIIETGFISNPGDRHMLTKDSNQEKLAVAISLAIQEYFYVFSVR